MEHFSKISLETLLGICIKAGTTEYCGCRDVSLASKFLGSKVMAKADVPDSAPKLGVDLGSNEAPVNPMP